MKKPRNGLIKNLHYLCLMGVIGLGLMTIVGTGGGGGGGTTATDTTPATDTTTGGPYTISGYIQKGPFISGSSITIQELDNDLNPTGISYETTTIYDFGAFSLGSQIESRYVEVIASGFYFDEVKGELSAANLRLRATADLLAGEDVNINILTTLEQGRIEYLIANEGLTFTEARAQAEIEVLSIFNISGENISTFDQMDISQEGDSNAVLLAVSSILHGTNTVAELSELISKISLDIREDGTLDNSSYIDEIKNNSVNLDLEVVRANLTNRYESLGLTVTIPGFEAYVDSDGDGVLNGDDEDSVADGPTNVSATRGNEQVTISWDTVSGARSYNIYWSTSSGVSKTNYEGKTEDITTTSYTHTGLTNGTPYYYVVTAENSYGESVESGEVTATPSATGTAPSTPTNVSSIGGAEKITISWDTVSGARSYNIYWSTSSGVSKTDYEGKIEDITTTSYTHTGLTNGTPYYYVVTAENSYGESVESGEVNATPSAPTYPDTVVDTIYVGDWPMGVAVTPDGSYVYVTNFSDHTVSVIQTSDNTVIDTISVGHYPEGIAVTPNGSYVYVANGWNDTVSVIRTSDNAVVDTIPVGDGPGYIAVTPNGSYVYVPNRDDDTMSVIRTSDNTVVDTIYPGSGPFDVVVTPDGSYAYVSNRDDNAVSVIKTSDNTVIDTISIGNYPHGIAVTPNGSYVYVINHHGGSVSVIRTSDNTVVDTIPVGGHLIAVTPNGSYVYVANGDEDTVSVIRTSDNTVVDSIYPGSDPRGVVVTPDGSYVYVATGGDDTVSVIGFSE